MEHEFRIGALVYKEKINRYDIRFDIDEYYGDLRCGDCMEVYIKKEWIPTHIEFGDSWYLSGINTSDINGLLVRIKI